MIEICHLLRSDVDLGDPFALYIIRRYGFCSRSLLITYLVLSDSNARGAPIKQRRTAGEVAVQLMHLFTEVAAYASTLPSIAVAHPAGLLSPMVRSISALTSARATQVAAARALSRVAAANATCRTTIIRLARNPQLLARLVSPTAEEMEVGEFAESVDVVKGRWRILE